MFEDGRDWVSLRGAVYDGQMRECRKTREVIPACGFVIVETEWRWVVGGGEHGAHRGCGEVDAEVRHRVPHAARVPSIAARHPQEVLLFGASECLQSGDVVVGKALASGEEKTAREAVHALARFEDVDDGGGRAHGEDAEVLHAPLGERRGFGGERGEEGLQ